MTHHALILATPWPLVAAGLGMTSGFGILFCAAMLHTVGWSFRASRTTTAAVVIMGMDCIGRGAYTAFTGFISFGAFVAMAVFCACVVAIAAEVTIRARRKVGGA